MIKRHDFLHQPGIVKNLLLSNKKVFKKMKNCYGFNMMFSVQSLFFIYFFYLKRKVKLFIFSY